MQKGIKVLAVIMLLVGVSLLLYPQISNLLTEYEQKQVIESYIGTVKEIKHEQHDELFAAANSYNEKLHALQKKGVYQKDGLEGYSNILKIDDTGIMGYIEIPTINVRIPIYHGTDENVLQAGIGHSGYTSVPVGGKSTRAVLFGHSALPQTKLFTDLEILHADDYFSVTVLNQKLNYKIIKTEIMLPNELETRLSIEEGRDLITLVTCTPYGVNTHRLAVTGERTADDVKELTEELVVKQEKKYRNLKLLLCIVVATIVVAITTIVVIFALKKRTKNRKTPHKK